MQRRAIRLRRTVFAIVVVTAVAGGAGVVAAGPNSSAGVTTSRHGGRHASLHTPIGIDVSNYQHPHHRRIHWRQVAHHGVQFTYIKATQAANFTNPWLARDWTGSGKVGILHGAYDFAEPSRQPKSASRQARYFARTIGSLSGADSLPPALDLEVTNGLKPHRLIAWTSRWIKTMRKVSGRRPIVYSYPLFWRHAMGGTHRFRAERLWGACYCGEPTTFSGAWSTWTFWQTGDTGRIKGIRGDVDLDRFAQSRLELRELAEIPSPTPIATTPPSAPPSPAATTLVASAPSSVMPAADFTLSGTLATSGTAQAPVANAPVEILQRSNSTDPWESVEVATTNTQGEIKASLQTLTTTQYKLRFAGDSSDAASVSKRVVVRVLGVGSA